MRKTNKSFILPLGSDEEEPDHVFPSPLVTKFLIPFGLLLIAALALGENYEKLPQWVLLAAVLYLALVAVVSLAYPAKQVFTWLREQQTQRQMARRFCRGLDETETI